MTQLVPCNHCSRHVHVSEDSCPFCRAALDTSTITAPGIPTERLGRAALFAFGAGLIACSSGSGTTSDRDGGSGGSGGTGAVGPAYGVPPDDSGLGGSSGSAGNAGSAGTAGAAGNAGSAGMAGSGGVAGAAGQGSGGEAGGPMPLYGLPPSP